MSEIGETETIFLFTFRLLPREYKKERFFFLLGLTSYVCCTVVSIDFSFSGYKLDLNVTYGNVFAQNIISKKWERIYFFFLVLLCEKFCRSGPFRMNRNFVSHIRSKQSS